MHKVKSFLPEDVSGGTEHFMKQINGVTSTQVGYANGKTSIKNPTYDRYVTTIPDLPRQ